MPGDPFASEKLTPEIRANLESYYGFDKPLIVTVFHIFKKPHNRGFRIFHVLSKSKSK